MKLRAFQLGWLLNGGDPRRSSRFHTGENQALPPRAWRNLLRSLAGRIWTSVTGIRPVVPWIPFSATAALDRLIKPRWDALEIGAGSSTVWLAVRCRRLVSIEADEGWHAKITDEVRRRNLSNVSLRYEWRAEAMANFDEFADGSLGLVFVDGGPREACVRAALPKLGSGGVLYVDNTDLQETSGASKSLLREHLHRRGGELHVHRDFIPCTPCAGEGIIYVAPAA